jgi:3D (Asp-Asp-Asp) domain-containing protein
MMRRHDKRTREQRKADESALFAAGCFGLTLILIGIALLLTGCSLVLLSVDAKDVDEPEAPVVEEYDPAWDIPATESAVCNDVFLGEFTLTAYCPGRCCCGKWASGYTATGTLATEGRTIAVDPKVIPYGTHVLLIWPDGTQHSYISEDCGGGVNGNHIDVFFNDHQAARVFGVQSAMVYLEAEE